MDKSEMMARSDEYLAKPSGSCCLEGTIHEGEARGRWGMIEGIETYITTPPRTKANGHILLYFPDIWGLFLNSLLVMDAFADTGYLTLGLDYFCGDPVWKHRKDRHDKTTDPTFDYEAWKKKHLEFADEAVPRWVKAVAAQYGTPGVKIACVGYCFGAPYVCSELAKETVTAGAFAHPAFLQEHHFRKINKPLFLSCAETDHTFDVPSRRRALDILQEEKKIYNYQLFAGVEHGFALRGDPEDPYQLDNKDDPPTSPGFCRRCRYRDRRVRGWIALNEDANPGAADEIGNGRATAILARHGAKVALLDINVVWAKETKRMIDEEGETSEVIHADVTDEVKSAAARTRVNVTSNGSNGSLRYPRDAKARARLNRQHVVGQWL
ncbi:hypothetical protein RRF57_006331 [Xylaria bambusicola]|uniref:Dienelactone hydrolase domain-containing protein n=1 Tax=Xylaria bambusicola TaxID=326684 RepID=A0AAN7UQ29_9PEZI